MSKYVAFLFLFLVLAPQISLAECRRHIELLSAKEVAKEYGKSEAWIVRNHRVNLWDNQSPKKFPKVGELLPGSRALLIKEGPDDYKVKSPFDGSVGWVSKIQVAKTLFQDTETREPCKK